MAEKEILNSGGVLVTTKRFVSRGTTYQLKTITSVRGKYVTPTKMGGPVIILAGIGALAAVYLNGGNGVCLFGSGGIVALGVVALFATTKPTGELFVTTSAREMSALKGGGDHVRSVESALHEAMSEAD